LWLIVVVEEKKPSSFVALNCSIFACDTKKTENEELGEWSGAMDEHGN
jgi:hypothetical protein